MRRIRGGARYLDGVFWWRYSEWIEPLGFRRVDGLWHYTHNNKLWIRCTYDTEPVNFRRINGAWYYTYNSEVHNEAT